jgi:hypothetical protein
MRSNAVTDVSTARMPFTRAGRSMAVRSPSRPDDDQLGDLVDQRREGGHGLAGLVRIPVGADSCHPVCDPI